MSADGHQNQAPSTLAFCIMSMRDVALRSCLRQDTYFYTRVDGHYIVCKSIESLSLINNPT
jgi:hypothetical protein